MAKIINPRKGYKCKACGWGWFASVMPGTNIYAVPKLCPFCHNPWNIKPKKFIHWQRRKKYKYER